jgi:hypothetical protein
MRRSTFLLAAIGVLTLGLAASWSIGGVLGSRTEQQRFNAAWKYRAVSVDQMARDVHAVAVARFKGARPGRVAYSSNHESSVSFELNQFVVERGIKGVPTGTKLVLERASALQDGRAPVFPDHDGGPFEVGGRYLLFLNKQSDANVYYQVNDEARYGVGSDDRLRTSARGKVAATLSGRSVSEASSLLKQAIAVP